MIVNCATCGNETKKSPAEIKKSKSGRLFCSRSCSASANNRFNRHGERNPNFKTGKSSYRKIVKLEKCNRCGYDKYPQILEVHHIDNDRQNNDQANLEVLCPNCHTVEHKIGSGV